MRRAVGLNPVVSITALLVGGSLGGVIGAILAIPVTTALSVFAQDFLEKKREQELTLEE
jgi:predicted PurR-regulated permease PerM